MSSKIETVSYYLRSRDTKKNAQWQDGMQGTDIVDIMTPFTKAYQVVMARGQGAYSRIKPTIEGRFWNANFES